MTRPSDIPSEVWERADILRDQFQKIEDDTEFVARIIMEVGKGTQVGMTERQRKAFEFVSAHIAQADGVPPTMREIASALGVAVSRAHSVMKQLEHRGLITSVPRRPRSMAIVTHSDDVSTAHKISVEA